MEILTGHVGSDHIHLLVSVPPHLSAGKLVQYIKENTSRKLQMEYKELNKQFLGKHLWAMGYSVTSSGNVTDEVIKGYIKNQNLQKRTKSDNLELCLFQSMVYLHFCPYIFCSYFRILLDIFNYVSDQH